MSNVQQLIKVNNYFIENKKKKRALSCNSLGKNRFALNGNCRIWEIYKWEIYKCKNNV